MALILGEELRSLLDKVLTRSRETALVGFNEARKRIENEQAAKGVLGGMVAHRCVEVAGDRIKSFAQAARTDLLTALTGANELSRESVQWVRETLNAQVESLVNGLGGQIDALKTTGGLRGNAGRLERYGLEAKQDIDIALSHVELGLPKSTRRAPRPMYQLLVSGAEHAWNGSPIAFDRHRVFEYTDADVKAHFARFDAEAVAALLALPCVFAYEETVGKAPLFGRLTHIFPAEPVVKLYYEMVPIDPFLTAADWEKAGGELGIRDRFERCRTHWAIKEVDLAQVLGGKGIALPGSAARPPVDIETHHFDVALSFPGERRDLVARIAERLEQVLGPNSVFYDAFYPGELAQPDLDLPRRLGANLGRVSMSASLAGVQQPRFLEIIGVGFGDPYTGVDLLKVVNDVKALRRSGVRNLPSGLDGVIRQFEEAAPERMRVAQRLRALLTQAGGEADESDLPIALRLFLKQVDAMIAGRVIPLDPEIVGLAAVRARHSGSPMGDCILVSVRVMLSGQEATRSLAKYFLDVATGGPPAPAPIFGQAQLRSAAEEVRCLADRAVGGIRMLMSRAQDRSSPIAT